MPEYRNPSTGVVVSAPSEVGDRLVGFQPVTAQAEEAERKPAPKRAPRRKPKN